MGTVTIALLQLAADDPESEVWCLAVEETGYLRLIIDTLIRRLRLEFDLAVLLASLCSGLIIVSLIIRLLTVVAVLTHGIWRNR